jgi:hypothetical protein
MSEELLLKFRYEEKDFVDVARLRVATAFRGRLDLAAAGAICALGLVVGYLYAPRWVWQLAALGLGLAAALVATMLYMAVFVAPRILFQRQAGQLDMSIELSDEGISVVAGKQRGKIKWASCTGLEANARAYLLRHGDKAMLMLPRRVFRSERQEDAFRKLVDRFVGGREPVP